MSNTSFSFPHRKVTFNGVVIPYPMVKVRLKTPFGHQPFSFILDTGADNTTLPHYMIQLLGLDITALPTSQSRGIGTALVKTWEAVIRLTIGTIAFNAHCSFTDNNHTPLLLGKENMFDLFNIEINNDRGLTIFQTR